MTDERFGDYDPDDGYDADDHRIDRARLDAARAQIPAINVIADDAERKRAAIDWARRWWGERDG